MQNFEVGAERDQTADRDQKKKSFTSKLIPLNLMRYVFLAFRYFRQFLRNPGLSETYGHPLYYIPAYPGI